MIVLKFGGTSVGTAEALRHVQQIVSAAPRPAVVVVSALGGVTDALVSLMRRTAAGEPGYSEAVGEIALRHRRIVDELVPPERRAALNERLDALFGELRSILHGVSLLRELTQKTADAIVAYGERLSSLLVAELMEGAAHCRSTELIKTRRQGGRHLVDFAETGRLLRDELGRGGRHGSDKELAVMGGFIASDLESGAVTNLGRGGSDYTAAIVAAALDAERLEIWTDVDGFMTADPRIIPSAVPIDRLSYAEATELCNFGAKVVYPPTLYPVCRKRIPLYVKNTFNPSAPGTLISGEAAQGERPVRGISSVNEMSIVTVSGLSMVGVVGVNRRIFTTLAAGGISVFMVAQNASETSTSICMTEADAHRACQLLDEEFAAEIADGSMNPASCDDGLATVAAVGERMKGKPGIAGQLFSVLGRNGISIRAVAMGGQEINLSFVVDKKQLRKTLHVLHDSFFLSEHEVLNLFICGTGTVGGSLLEQIAAQQERLARERGLRLRVVGVGGRHAATFSPEGIDPARWREVLAQGGAGGVGPMVEEIERMNVFNSVFVDCTASAEVAACYERLLRHNVSVVAANKLAASSSYEHYRLLKDTARERGVKFLFETNVGAGLPILSTIGDLRTSGDRVLRIEAVLSGTLNFVFNALSAQTPFSRAVRLALEKGYSEPDPRVDLSGKDVVRKLAILVRESGYPIEMGDIRRELFIPERLFAGTPDDFWRELPSLDEAFERERLRLEAEGKRWRFVAEWADGEGSVGLREVERGHPFYAVEGSNNILLLTTERYRRYPMLIQGYGAGAAVTAAGVFADIMRVANV